jgi:hypothetical protein
MEGWSKLTAIAFACSIFQHARENLLNHRPRESDRHGSRVIAYLHLDNVAPSASGDCISDPDCVKSPGLQGPNPSDRGFIVGGRLGSTIAGN